MIQGQQWQPALTQALFSVLYALSLTSSHTALKKVKQLAQGRTAGKQWGCFTPQAGWVQSVLPWFYSLAVLKNHYVSKKTTGGWKAGEAKARAKERGSPGSLGQHMKLEVVRNCPEGCMETYERTQVTADSRTEWSCAKVVRAAPGGWI